MGEIVLARVDERLIHGQIMVNVAQSSGADSIYVINDAVSKDEFLQQVYAGTARRGNLRTKFYSVEAAIARWNKTQFGKRKVLLLTKNVADMVALVRGGLAIKKVNLGNVANRPNTVAVIGSVHITADEFHDLEDIHQKNGVEVYFQEMPGNAATSVEEAAKKF